MNLCNAQYRSVLCILGTITFYICMFVTSAHHILMALAIHVIGDCRLAGTSGLSSCHIGIKYLFDNPEEIAHSAGIGSDM